MIVVTQSCDGCGLSRFLTVGYSGDLGTIKRAANLGGWREVREFKHLCTDCINNALSPHPTTNEQNP